MHKKFYIFLIAIVFIVIVAFLGFFYFLHQPQKLEVDFLDVGQGDAELIKTQFGQNILIDGGPDDTILKRLAENLPLWDRKIDLMILTHPHADHVAGLVNVLERYEVKQILYTGVSEGDPPYSSWLDLIKKKNIPTIIVDRPQIIVLGENLKFKILFPLQSLVGQGVENLNNTSIVALLENRNVKMLFMGDAEQAEEQELIKSGTDIQAQVLKVGHHGSDTASSEKLLNKVKPEIAVIPVGKNDFGLPSLRVIKRLERIGAKVLRTDENETIILTSTGDGVEILQ
jgi:competence protein ComEC